MPHKDPEVAREYMRAYKKAWAARNLEHVREYRRQWRASHIEEAREQSRRARAKKPVNTSVRYHHGFADGELAALFAEQDGRCAICDSPFPMRGQGCLHIDHDHESGIRRGLLCKPCNTALKAVDNLGASWVLRALAYLGDPPLPRMRRRRGKEDAS